MATSEGIPSSIDIEFLELNDNPYTKGLVQNHCHKIGSKIKKCQCKAMALSY